ncbi:hypothetical protein OAD75_06110 [Gammaproteobacteria bacterium]|nr:hypothetical protein [Gammaproteobacteria bacterium]
MAKLAASKAELSNPLNVCDSCDSNFEEDNSCNCLKCKNKSGYLCVPTGEISDRNRRKLGYQNYDGDASMKSNLWFSQTGADMPMSMGLPMENATSKEISEDIGLKLPNRNVKSNSPLPQPTMPTQRGCGSNQYTIPFKIQGEEKCIDKTIAMVIGAIGIYYLIKK